MKLKSIIGVGFNAFKSNIRGNGYLTIIQRTSVPPTAEGLTTYNLFGKAARLQYRLLTTTMAQLIKYV